MRKYYSAICVAPWLLILASCGIPKDEYQRVKRDLDESSRQLVETQMEVGRFKNEIRSAQAKIDQQEVIICVLKNELASALLKNEILNQEITSKPANAPRESEKDGKSIITAVADRISSYRTDGATTAALTGIMKVIENKISELKPTSVPSSKETTSQYKQVDKDPLQTLRESLRDELRKYAHKHKGEYNASTRTHLDVDYGKRGQAFYFEPENAPILNTLDLSLTRAQEIRTQIMALKARSSMR